MRYIEKAFVGLYLLHMIGSNVQYLFLSFKAVLFLLNVLYKGNKYLGHTVRYKAKLTHFCVTFDIPYATFVSLIFKTKYFVHVQIDQAVLIHC